MNIAGLNNYNEIANIRPADKGGSQANNNVAGNAFSQSLAEVAKAVNMQVASESGAATLNLSTKKDKEVELFSFTEAGEKIIDEHIAQIEKLLSDFQRK
ncbi:MAG: hypothetical protein PHH14_05370 [Candidatus Margulisbacteria bacterium]|nr:hypothetical protein [Candidatus Margulisiibacteriota bacterium]